MTSTEIDKSTDQCIEQTCEKSTVVGMKKHILAVSHVK